MFADGQRIKEPILKGLKQRSETVKNKAFDLVIEILYDPPEAVWPSTSCFRAPEKSANLWIFPPRRWGPRWRNHPALRHQRKMAAGGKTVTALRRFGCCKRLTPEVGGCVHARGAGGGGGGGGGGGVGDRSERRVCGLSSTKKLHQPPAATCSQRLEISFHASRSRPPPPHRALGRDGGGASSRQL